MVAGLGETCSACRGCKQQLIPRSSKMLAKFAWLALACVALTTPCFGAVPAGTAIISQSEGQTDTQLLEAFSDPSIKLIMLAGDYAVGSQFDKWNGPLSEGIPFFEIHR